MIPRMNPKSHLKDDNSADVKRLYPHFAVAESLSRKALAELNARQAIFAAKYVETFSMSTAAEAAGFDPSTASDVIRNPLVARAVQLLQTDKLHKIEAGMEVNSEMIIRGIVRNIHALEAKGKNEATFKGYELLGKHLSMWTEKIDISTDTPSLSPEDRAAKIAALVALANARAANTIDVEHTPVPISAPSITPADTTNDSGDDLL